MSDLQNRRIFLRAAVAAGAAWTVADVIQVEEALAWTAQHNERQQQQHQHAQQAAPARAVTKVLTRAQADALDAMTSRILPSVDGRAGAHEAGVVLFIDRSLATFNADRKPFYVEGVQDLDSRAALVAHEATATFASLTPAQQDDVLRQIEQTPFFQALRFDTIVGTFALPTYGGNRDYAGWHMLGFEHQPAFTAPFGYYDAGANGGR